MTDSVSKQRYNVCFEGGHQFRLLDHPGTFKVSQAGVALGNQLVGNLSAAELGGRILDVGTGSGSIAMLMRAMGATSVTATEISVAAVATARLNELENYGNAAIEFFQCDLFPPGGNDRYDLIIFNPPGWRTPPGLLSDGPAQRRHSDLDGMFNGDEVLLRFLTRLPAHLAKNGRVIIGLNSLVGIADIIERARKHTGSPQSTIISRVLARYEFPLMFYSYDCEITRASVLTEFERGREAYAATYVTKGDTIHWFYEITEISLNDVVVPVMPPGSTQQQSIVG